MNLIIPKSTAKKAVMEGLSEPEEVISRIREFVKYSARITHPKGNRRYEEWVFKVTKNGRVDDVHLIKCELCEDHGRIAVYDICEYCDGDGCGKCNNTGERKSSIPCQECG